MNRNKLWTLQFQDSTNPQHFLVTMVEVKTPVLKAIEMAHSTDKLNEVSYIMDANGMLTDFQRFKGLLHGVFCDADNIVTLFNKKWMPIPENSEDTGSDFGVTTGTFTVKPDSVVPKTNCWHLHVNGPFGNHAIPVVVGPTIDEAMERLNIARGSYRLVDDHIAAWDRVPTEGTDVTIEYIGAKVVEEPPVPTWPSSWKYTETANSIKTAMQRFDAEFGDKDMSLFEKSVWEVVFYTEEVEMRYTLDGMDISEAITDVQSFIEKHKSAHVFKSVSIQRA